MSDDRGLDGDLLKLKAADSDDLQVIAGVLQDAIVPILDIAYDARERCFMFAANRFRWEKPPLETGVEAGPGGERVHCGVSFANVAAVRRKGINRGRPATFLNLLTITLEEPPDGKGPGCARPPPSHRLAAPHAHKLWALSRAWSVSVAEAVLFE